MLSVNVSAALAGDDARRLAAFIGQASTYAELTGAEFAGVSLNVDAAGRLTVSAAGIRPLTFATRETCPCGAPSTIAHPRTGAPSCGHPACVAHATLAHLGAASPGAALTREDAARELTAGGWPTVAEDVIAGLSVETLLRRLDAIGEGESDAAAIVGAIREGD